MSYLRNFVFAVAVIIPVTAQGQDQQNQQATVQTSTVSQQPVGASTCSMSKVQPSKLDPTALEKNDAVLSAAVGIATQFNTSQKSDPDSLNNVLDGETNTLMNYILAAAFGSKSIDGCQLSPSGAQQVATQSATSRTDKQTGAPASSNGTTSAVQGTGIPELLTIAEENGAISSSSSGSTMTLSTSLFGLLNGFGVVTGDDTSYRQYLGNRLGASATFNVGSSSDQLASATRKQISQWQLKYSFFDLTTRSSLVTKMWMSGSNGKSPQYYASQLAASYRPNQGTPGLAETTNLQATIFKAISSKMENISASLNKIKNATTSMSDSAGTTSCSAIAQPTVNELGKQILACLDQDRAFQDELSTDLKSQDIAAFINTRFLPALANYQKSEAAFETAVANLSKGKNGFNGDVNFGQQFPTTTTASGAASTTTGNSSVQASSSDTTATPHQPDYLYAGLDLSWRPTAKVNPNAGAVSGGPANNATPVDPSKGLPSLTLNFLSSFYTQPNAALNESTFRGGKGALQLQWSLGKGPFVKDANDKDQVTIAANGSYERLQENSGQAGKRPGIALGNLKLSIPIAGGITFPLAITFANGKPQQSKGVYTVGNFGISFDLDKLSALLKANH